MRVLAGIQEINACICIQGPVIMLAGPIDPCKRFLMEQAYQIMTQGNLLHDFHDQLVMVCGNIGRVVNGSQFMLARSSFIVLGLGGDAKLPEFLIELCHKSKYALFDGAKIVIIQLLALGRLCPKQSTAGKNQVFSFIIGLTINQEILLLRPDTGNDLCGLCIAEKTDDSQCLGVDRFHGTQKGCFLVKRLSCVGAENRRNTKDRRSIRKLTDKGRGRAVPCCVASCLKGSPDTAGREGRTVRFTLEQLFPGKRHQYRTVALRIDKSIMLLCGNVCQRLEPVGVMCRPFIDSPLFHLVGNDFGYMRLQVFSFHQGIFKLCIDFLWKAVFHRCIVKNIRGKHFNHIVSFRHSFSYSCILPI